MPLWCKESWWKAGAWYGVSIESPYRIIKGLFKTYQEKSNQYFKYLSLDVSMMKFLIFQLCVICPEQPTSPNVPVRKVLQSSTRMKEFQFTTSKKTAVIFLLSLGVTYIWGGCTGLYVVGWGGWESIPTHLYFPFFHWFMYILVYQLA